MRLHRFYISPKDLELEHEIWVKSPELRNQWLKVFRYHEGDEVVLFDGVAVERLYKLAQVEKDAVKLKQVTDFERKLPKKHIYLFWSLLKKDKNEWVIQKCTELGVSNFVPIVAERSEKTGFNVERAEKIAIEAAEQCGRSDIPHIREPLTQEEAVNEYINKIHLLACDEQLGEATTEHLAKIDQPFGVFIGPEGGWNEDEIAYFEMHCIDGLPLGNLVLRAETAAVAASTRLLA